MPNGCIIQCKGGEIISARRHLANLDTLGKS